MKRLILSKSLLLISLGVVLAVLSISNSCTKSSTDPTGGGGSNQPGANEVWLQNRAFTPASITVAVGTTVKWTNKDSYTHNVTSSTAVFNSGSMGNGAIFTFQFTAAGTYPYTCTLHPGMAGTVIVQ
jgi:plastocyanin